jgi:hypothetical protein
VTTSSRRAGRALFERLRRLSPASEPLWGRLSAPQMLAHLVDAARLGLGQSEPPAQGRGVARLLGHPPLKQLFVYLLPFPRHAPRVPALFVTTPGVWADDVATLERLTERLAERAGERGAHWPRHPYFGRMSRRAWGVLGWKHMDHHLRQFGV